MKVRNRYTRGLDSSAPLRNRQRVDGVSEARSASGPLDRVNISGRGVEIRRARSLALRAPEIRQELVDEIVSQMGRGQYRVTGAQVVPKMIREHVALTLG